MDDDDRDSNASSDNEQDEVMEEVDDVEPEPEPEPEPENEPEEDENDEEDAEEEEPDQEEPFRDASGVDGKPTTGGSAATRSVSTPPRHDGPASGWRPTVRPEAVTAKLYDIVPTMAAPQSTSINGIAITPDLRYWMTGGSDGYIRKYDGAATINGKQLLTVAQRHPFVDSVVKAGVLMSYWENEEPSPPSAKGGIDEHVLSPVYSLAVHSRALWLLSGTESGGINLQSVRHDEGKRITCLQRHTNAVSVLQLAPDEKSVLSGSWDKNIFSWDLNNGQVSRQFDGSGSQISAIELRPASGAPLPAEAAEEPIAESETYSSNYAQPLRNGFVANGAEAEYNDSNNPDTAMVNSTVQPPAANGEIGAVDAPGGSEHESLFGSPGGSLFGEDAMGGNTFGGGGDDDNEFSQAMLALQGDSNDGGHSMEQADVSMMDMSGDAPASLEPDGATPPAVQPPPNVGLPDQTQDTGLNGGSIAPLAGGQAPPRAVNGEGSKSGELFQDQLFNYQNGSAPGAPAEISSRGGQPQEPPPGSPSLLFASNPPPAQHDQTQSSDSTFFSASIDGTIRIWDRRVPNPVARIGNRPGVPPWCMGACWSPDGNWIYAGRRNGTVEEFNVHKARAGWAPERALKLPAGSGAVSAVRAMPNGRHLICASHDILRLYDLRDTTSLKHSTVPFLIVPGPPRAGVISCLYIDPTARFMITAAGTRGWDGSSTEVLIGYEIGVVDP
ncbi:Transcription factor protein [Pleurostoma richardsiae]|uniref:Transcription factor protein n=1 Tax=Pleurostoma richardsiae TaxID=41990 RepID=A0AA38VBD1_9PEZI|nr:Transcription factor protein [Pleurostoma richardsiae]